LEDTGGTTEPLGASNLGSFLLARLERFVGRLADPGVRGIPAWHRLARHATAAGIADCLALGLAHEAITILNAAHGDLPHPA
jgi:hypothetical protein